MPVAEKHAQAALRFAVALRRCLLPITTRLRIVTRDTITVEIKLAHRVLRHIIL